MMECLYRVAGEIGIIGGADGPTAIFVTSRISPLGIILLAAAVVCIGALIVRAVRRRRK